MNPLNPIMKLLKAIFFILMLPFMVIGMVFQGVWMLFAGILSVTVYLLAFACILAALGALLGAPFFFLTRTHQHDEHVPSLYQMHRTERTPDVAWQTTQSSRGRATKAEVVYVGPHGRQLRIETRRTRGVEIPTPPPAPVIAEINENDVDFSELGTTLAAAEAKLAKQLTTKARAIERVMSDSLATHEAVEALESETTRERPDWVDAILSGEDELSKVRVEAGPCVSREACEMAYRDAQDHAVADYVRDRSEVCLADLGITTMPWHELTVQRIAQNLRLRPADEFADTHDVTLADESQRTYFKYGLLEFSPEIRDHIDREITRWARSFLAGGMWGVVLAGIGGVYLLLQFNGWKKLCGTFSTRRRTAALAVVMVLGVALAALTAIL